MYKNINEDGISVITRESEGIESLLRRFKRKVNKSEILKEYKLTTEYIKPSVKRRKKSMDARRRIVRELVKMEKDIKKKKKKKGDLKKYEKVTSNQR